MLNRTWKHISIFLSLNCFRLHGLQSTGIACHAKTSQKSFGCKYIASPDFPQPHIADIIWSVRTTVILILSALRVTGFSVSRNLRKMSSELQTNFWTICMNSGRGKEKWRRVRTWLEAFEKSLPCVTNAYCVLEFSKGKCLLGGWWDNRKFLLVEHRSEGEKERGLLSASVS